MRSTLKCDIMTRHHDRGIDLMKTKIIYISGGEIFDMRYIRSALDDVRNALGLGSDTVLFGVPVDNDCAITNNTRPQDIMQNVVNESHTFDDVTSENAQITCVTTELETVPSDILETPDDITDEDLQSLIISDDIITDYETAEMTQPDESNVSMPASEMTQPAETTTTNSDLSDTLDENKVIPILSFLGAKRNKSKPAKNVTIVTESVSENIITDAEQNIESAETETTEEISNKDCNTTETIEDVVIQNIEIASDNDKSDTVTPQRVTIEDMIIDKAPEPQIEQTLEQLLESMAPLREDRNDNLYENTNESASNSSDDLNIATVSANEISDTDATLAQLATEFAENEEKIPTPAKSQGHGKISKLKNIIPFKARREDKGFMDDLFGWAGLAANDDEFSMPGFFTGVASNK